MKSILVALVALMLVPSALAALGQDVAEGPHHIVYVPAGGSVCHRVWAVSDYGEDKNGQVMIEMGKLPDFVTVKMVTMVGRLSDGSPIIGEVDPPADGVYNVTDGKSDSIIFHIEPPADALIGSMYKIRLTPTSAPSEGGTMQQVEKIASGFEIHIVEAGTKVQSNCEPLPSDPAQVEATRCEDGSCMEINEVSTASVVGISDRDNVFMYAYLVVLIGLIFATTFVYRRDKKLKETKEKMNERYGYP